MMKIESELSKYKKFEPYIIEIIERQYIPNVTRLILGETHGELTIIILTKNYLRSEYESKVRENIKSDLINYMGIDVFMVFIDKDPDIK
jgi:hypothetical protein